MRLEDKDFCQLKKESTERYKRRDTVDLPENPLYACHHCDGYDFDCPEYTPMENTP